MGRLLALATLLVFTLAGQAQELNARVQVNADLTSQPDLQIFRSLERSITEFLNETQWTTTDYRENERIDCSFVFIINSYESDRFTASLQVQSSRPTYGSSYTTTLLNHKDDDANFQYVEFQPLVYSSNQYQNNLTSLLAYYVYTILGLDADSFELNGGTQYHEEVQRIVNLAGTSGEGGWSTTDGRNSRFAINNDMLINTYKEYREAMYNYHLTGLDIMHMNTKAGKQSIARTLESLKAMNQRRPNSALLRLFFDAKADELATVFNGGPSIQMAAVIDNLQRLAPYYSTKWRNLRN